MYVQYKVFFVPWLTFLFYYTSLLCVWNYFDIPIFQKYMFLRKVNWLYNIYSITITKSGRLTPLNSNYWKAYFLSKKSLDQSTSFDWSRPSHVRQSAPLDWLCLLIGCCRVTWWQSAPLDWLRVGIVDVDESLYLLYIYIPLTIILRHYHYYHYYYYY